MTIFLNTLVTIVSGVVVFIFGQLFIELIVKPLRRYKEIKAKIAFNLVFYASLYCNPITPIQYEEGRQKADYDMAQNELRKLAAELTGFAEEKWFFNYPRIEKIKKVASDLIGISNSMIRSENSLIKVIEYNEKRVQDIRKLLRLRIKEA